MDRYSKNRDSLLPADNELLFSRRVAVVGCGGLGGYVIEFLARLGLGQITAIDYDVFETSNLNRQLLCHEGALGRPKAGLAQERVRAINSTVELRSVEAYLDRQNADQLLGGHDLVIDALDNIESRLILEEAAARLRLPLVHGAIAGWYGQVTTVLPGDGSLAKIYANKQARGVEQRLGNLAFTPALVASIQVSQALKVLLKRGELIRKKLLLIDLMDNEFNYIDI